MICSKCGQELKDGSKFCTKCGANFKHEINTTLPITSIILSVIGIIGSLFMRYGIFGQIAYILLYASIILALIIQNKQKSLIGFIAGIIPCVYLIFMQVYWLIMTS